MTSHYNQDEIRHKQTIRYSRLQVILTVLGLIIAIIGILAAVWIGLRQLEISQTTGPSPRPAPPPNPVKTLQLTYTLPIRASDKSRSSLKAQTALEDAVEKAMQTASAPLRGSPRIDLIATTNIPPDNLTMQFVVSYIRDGVAVSCPVEARSGDVYDNADHIAAQVVQQFTKTTKEQIECPG